MPINSFDDYPMTWFPQRQQVSKPMYFTLADQLEQDIRSGKLLPGTKLPPQRELADYLDINVSTISRAFKVCTQKGLLSGTVGSGTFVSYNALASIKLLPQLSNDIVIELGSAVPEAMSYDEIAVILRKMLSEPDFGELFQYGIPEGKLWQREAAVRLLGQMGCETTQDKLLPSNGAQNAIAAALTGLFRAGDCIGTDPLTYPGLKSIAKMLGIELVPIGQENGEISEDGLLYACKNERIKGIYIMPEYQNPTTHIMTDSCRRMIANIAQKHNLIVIEDGIYSLLGEQPGKAVACYAPEQTIFIASFSKTFAPGLRLSYVVVPKQYYNSLSYALYNLNLTVSPFLLEIASRAIASGQAKKLADAHRNLVKKRNQIVDKMLAGYDLRGTQESIFRWLILPDGWTGHQFETKAYKAGVQIYGAERFAVGKSRPISAVRLSVSAADSSDELIEGLRRLSILLQEK